MLLEAPVLKSGPERAPDDPPAGEDVAAHASASAAPPPEASAADARAGDPDTAAALRARDGDRAAMDTLVVARLLWRFARNAADLDDLVQDTFRRMVRGLPGWRAEMPFAHWLLRIAANTGRDYCRRHAVRRRWTVDPLAHTSTADDREPAAPEAIDPAPDPAARAALEEVKRLLATLPADDCALLTLHHLEGWPLAQIAADFGWTVTATKLRAWRARRHLRALYQASESP